MKPVIAIIGRPNVGKSTLFNRIVGRRAALVEDFPGVTRDRNYADAEYLGRELVVVDTGGFDPEADAGSMLALMKRQVEIALTEADALILVFDARDGLTPSDQAIWELVRRSGAKCYAVVNKVDKAQHEALAADFYALGVDPLHLTSAENGFGVAELLDTIIAELDPPKVGEAANAPEDGPTRIAVIGRPNVGKSTFANALLGRDRYLTSDQPGTTRDSVDTPFRVGERDYVLVDTAGIRRPRRVEAGIERMSVARSIQALERCHVAALLIDGAEGVTDQDKKLASLAIERGRGLVLVVNKWDLVKEERAGDAHSQRLKDEFTFAQWAPHAFISALKGRGVPKFLPLVDRVHANLFKRVPTHQLNLFYEEVVKTHPPHVGGTRLTKVRYLTQVQVNPPTVLLFAKGADSIPQAYIRFLLREFRDRYDFEGVPVRMIPR